MADDNSSTSALSTQDANEEDATPEGNVPSDGDAPRFSEAKSSREAFVNTRASRRLHKYLKAQGSQSDVQPHRGLYRKLSQHDNAMAVRRQLRQRAEVARGGTGTQYVLGVAGGADSIPSQVVVEDIAEETRENNRQQRPEYDCGEDGYERKHTGRAENAELGHPLGPVVSIVSIGSSSAEGNTLETDHFEDQLGYMDPLQRYSNIAS
jgi:hypothetical protein